MFLLSPISDNRVSHDVVQTGGRNPAERKPPVAPARGTLHSPVDKLERSAKWYCTVLTRYELRPPSQPSHPGARHVQQGWRSATHAEALQSSSLFFFRNPAPCWCGAVLQWTCTSASAVSGWGLLLGSSLAGGLDSSLTPRRV